MGGFDVEFVVIVEVDVHVQLDGGFCQGLVVHPRGGGAAGMEQQAHSKKNQQGFDMYCLFHFIIVRFYTFIDVFKHLDFI